MTAVPPDLRKRLLGFPAAGIAYSLVVAVVLGFGCGLFHAPFAAVLFIGLVVAGLAIWLEREALLTAKGGGRRQNVQLQLAAAFLFLAMVATGLVALGYFLFTAWRR
jgi:hypothetical protein